MSKCGVCGSHFGELLVKHGEICEDDRKAGSQPYGLEEGQEDDRSM